MTPVVYGFTTKYRVKLGLTLHPLLAILVTISARLAGSLAEFRLTGAGAWRSFMVKEVYFFTEMGYTAYPQDEARKHGFNNLMFPNEHFSPERANEL